MTFIITCCFNQGFQRNKSSMITSTILHGNLSLSTVSFPEHVNISNTLLSYKQTKKSILPCFCIYCGYHTLPPYKVNIQEVKFAYFSSLFFSVFWPSSVRLCATNNHWNHCFLPLLCPVASGPSSSLAGLCHLTL